MQSQKSFSQHKTHLTKLLPPPPPNSVWGFFQIVDFKNYQSINSLGIVFLHKRVPQNMTNNTM